MAGWLRKHRRKLKVRAETTGRLNDDLLVFVKQKQAVGGPFPLEQQGTTGGLQIIHKHGLHGLPRSCERTSSTVQYCTRYSTPPIPPDHECLSYLKDAYLTETDNAPYCTFWCIIEGFILRSDSDAPCT